MNITARHAACLFALATGAVGGSALAQEPPQIQQQSITAALQYPPTSERMNEQGAAVVQFFIDENSKVHDWTIALSSGASRLDEAAIKFIARASFDPAHVKLNPIHTDVPYKVTVVFCLEKGDCDRIATYPYSLRVVVLGERPKRRDIVVPIP